MNAGRVEQVGTGDEIYSAPQTAFVASFVGEANRLEGRIAARADGMAEIETGLGRFRGRNPQGLDLGQPAVIFIRPEAMQLGAGENRLHAQLQRRDLEGAFVNLFFDAQGHTIALHLTNSGAAQLSGDATHALGFAADQAVILPLGPLARTGQELAAQ
jgi:spermidine/putrescine transport system ATP-binding protein